MVQTNVHQRGRAGQSAGLPVEHTEWDITCFSRVGQHSADPALCIGFGVEWIRSQVRPDGRVRTDFAEFGGVFRF